MSSVIASTDFSSFSSLNHALDGLLADICTALQISQQHYDRAVRSYGSVGDWLRGAGSPLTMFRPKIYLQGSMALGTTTRPWTDEDTYDVDLVFEMDAPFSSPRLLYNMVEARLLAHGTYAKLLERKRRCLCLNYTEDDGIFHMDVLPARHDAIRGGTCIEVPDWSESGEWQPSNPQGYVNWFEAQAERGLALERGLRAPLPGHDPAQAKAILKRAVQLIKRRRDFVFRDRCDDAPRSIVLTTLAGLHYGGQLHLSGAILGILDGIAAQVRQSAPHRIVVCNPTNLDEKFCESFKTDTQYRLFLNFVDQFR